MSIPGSGEKMPTMVDSATGRDVPVDPVARPAGAVDPATAYEQGRADARRADALAADRERERVRERDAVKPRRKGSPLLTLIIVLLALVGAAWIYLSLTRGSAQQGGAVIDNKLSAVTAPAREAVDNARNATGQAVQNAGEALKSSGEKIKTP